MSTSPMIMIVDEDLTFREELQHQLVSWRVPVVAVSGYGIEASAVVEESKPDLILAAIEDPVARAVQTIESLRTTYPDIPVVAYTSHNDLAVARRAMHAGVKDILPKPLHPNDLLSAIREASNIDGEDEQAAQSAGTVLTVFGPKGGIGKTTISTNLATTIARDTKASVLIIDLDIRFGDVAIMMDVEPDITAAEMAANLSTYDRESFKRMLVQHPSGVTILPSPKHPNDWRAVDPDEIAELVRYSARIFDYVILDTPGTFNDIVATAIECSTQVLAVTSMDMASIKDTCFVLDLFANEDFPDHRVCVVANRSNPTHRLSVGDVERVLGKSIFWELPYDPEVSMASQAGTPVSLSRPKSRASQSFAGMVGLLTGSVAAPQKKSGLLDRLVSTSSRNRQAEPVRVAG